MRGALWQPRHDARPELRAWSEHLARVDHLSKKAEARGAFGAAVNAERLRAQVLGLFAPQAVAMQATFKTSPESSPEDEDLTPEQIDAELAAIAEVLGSVRREQQRAASEQPYGAAARDSRHPLQP